MQKYIIKDYQKGFEQAQVRIGFEVAQNWIWPYTYSLEDLLKIHARPDFDPDTRHYCFVGDEMVGYMFSLITPQGAGEIACANLEFPRMMPGHEGAAELLVERSFEALKKKGISLAVGRVTTMCPGDLRLAEKLGFSIHSWGYKVYYSYEMGWGKPEIPGDTAVEIDPKRDLEVCAKIASYWYKRPPEWCRSHLEAWHAAGLITHLGIFDNEGISAACMVASNDVRPSTAGIFYIYAPDEPNLTPLLGKAVAKCVDHGVQNLIADLINEHRQYEPVYQKLGFKKAAEWARCEKMIA